MNLDHRDMLRMHDNAYIASQDARERAANDLIFARWTHWDTGFISDNLEFRGEFDLLKKARRKNMGELRSNPVQVSFIAGMDGDDKTAGILEKKYRYDMSSQSARTCLIMAQQDQIDCGFGAWRLSTETTNDKYATQFIKRTPILEANNVIFYDPDCQEMDRSDASYVSIILSITDDGWEAFANSVGIDPENKPTSFRPPEDSYSFPWLISDKAYHISEFYHRYPVKIKTYTMEDAMGNEILIDEFEYDSKQNELEYKGFEVVDEGSYDSFKVKKYYVSGGEILKTQDIAGSEIPVVNVWGDTYKVEGQWIWEGIVRAAKDPQRLRDFMMSYIADIAAKGARQRPIFTRSQIAGLEYQFEAGSDNNRAFYVTNDFDVDGNPLPATPMGEIRPPEMPQAIAAILPELTQSVNDVADPGVLGESATGNIAHKTVATIQSNVDMQSFAFIDNTALALQREAEIYESMRREIMDTTQDIELLDMDGTETVEQINKPILNDDGELDYENDFSRGSYKVRTKVTQGYSSQRDQRRIEMQELLAQTPDPEAQKVMMLDVFKNLDDTDSYATKWGRSQAISMGLVDEEDLTDEERAQLEQQAQQPPQPDPMMVAAQAEMEKAQADKLDAQTNAMSAQVDQFNAETKRMDTMIKAKEAGAKVTNINADTQLKRANSGKTIREMVRGGRQTG
jgi:hypothetical protein